jgi:hypothetical protein
MSNDNWELLKEYIKRGRDNYLLAIRSDEECDKVSLLLLGRINECNEILRFMTELELPIESEEKDFTENSIANIDNQ